MVLQVCNRQNKRYLHQSIVFNFERGTTSTAAQSAIRCITVSSTTLRHFICCLTGVPALLSGTSSVSTFGVIFARIGSCEKKHIVLIISVYTVGFQSNDTFSQWSESNSSFSVVFCCHRFFHMYHELRQARYKFLFSALCFCEIQDCARESSPGVVSVAVIGLLIIKEQVILQTFEK